MVDFSIIIMDGADKITMLILKNTGKESELIDLLEFRNLIASQLFKMSKVGITKTLFDRVHQSMLLKDQNGTVIAGVCFYQILEHKCTSIIYFVVHPKYQAKGYGSSLMRMFKQQIRTRGHNTIATQADTISLNFYFKNGFIEFEKKNKKLQRQPIQDQFKEKQKQEEPYSRSRYKKHEPWLNYIEEYYSSLLLVYRIPPLVDFTNFKNIVAGQKQKLLSVLDEKSYRNCSFKREQMQSIMTAHRQLYEKKHGHIYDSKRLEAISTQLTNKQAGLWSCQKQTSKLQQIAILNILKSHECHWILKINFIKIPDTFHNELSSLITLPEIEQNVARDTYSSSLQLCGELTRLLQNLKLFLAQGSNYYQACEKLELFLRPYLTAICQGSFNAIQYLTATGNQIRSEN